MVIAINPNIPLRYVLRDDRNNPSENQTTFLFKVITKGKLSELEADFERIVKNKEGSAVNTDNVSIVLNKFLIGWENFKDTEGNTIEFVTDSKGVPKEEIWDYFYVSDLIELCEAVLVLNKLSGKEVKN
jgi:hypothetical protein